MSKTRFWRSVGLIALDVAAVVDENDLIFADNLWGRRAVGLGGGGRDLARGFAANPAAGISSVDQRGELAVGHAGGAGLVHSFVDGKGNVVGELQEGKLGGGFNTAAAGDDRDTGGHATRSDGLGDAVGEDELHAFVERQRKRRRRCGPERIRE
jgi:hypothetical protein